MITAYDTQTIGNGFIQALVEQETQKRMAAFHAEQALILAAKDNEIADLRRRLRIAEARTSKTYCKLNRKYRVERPGALRRVLESIWGLAVLIAVRVHG